MFNPTTSIKPVLYYYLDLSTSDDQSLLNCHHEEGGAKSTVVLCIRYVALGGTSDARNKRKYSYKLKANEFIFVPVDAFKIKLPIIFYTGSIPCIKCLF